VKISLTCALAALVTASIPLAAHHSFAAEYDAKTVVEFDAVVTKLEWTNPHAHFYVDVTDANGALSHWNFELASPNMLNRNGFTRKSLKEGDKVHVTGSRAKDGTTTASTSRIVFPDGHVLTMTGAQQGK
jgi:hypothetical protein